MRRDNSMRDDDGLPGQDSFLDIIANIVGILIILVMVVGVRASHSVSELGSAIQNSASASLRQVDFQEQAEAKDAAELRAKVEESAKQILKTHNEIEGMAQRVANLAIEANRQDQERLQLNMHRAVVEEDLQRRRGQLDDEKRQEFDVQRQIVQSQIELEQLTREQLALASAPAVVEEVESVATPMAKTVSGKEIHLRLIGGRVSIVPVERLMDEVYGRVDVIRSTLQGQSQVSETFGPIDGYRLRLRLRKQASRSLAAGIPGQAQQVHVDQEITFLPVSDDIGQTVEQALLPSSELQAHLKAHRREATPVTIWVYTDSFDEFRTLKRALWEMDFPIAVRPMSLGDHIGASPNGTKSAAQ